MFKEWQADDNFKFPFLLQPPHHYVGPAWFQREVEIPQDWAGCELELERVKWLSTLWIDGVEVDGGDSLGTSRSFAKPYAATACSHKRAISWSLNHGGTTITSGKLPVRDLSAGALHDVGSLSIDLSAAPAPAMLTLTLGDPALGFSNRWELFVYPQALTTEVPQNVVLTTDLNKALAALAEGRRVLWSPPAADIVDDPEYPLLAGFSPIFWNTVWTDWQPPHTLGILCDPEHPALSQFPTQFHSNWQWWEL